MRALIVKFWKDECGALIGTEWVFAVTIIFLGSAAGLLMMRNAAIRDLPEAGEAVESRSSYDGRANCNSFAPSSDLEQETDSDF